MKKVFSVLLLCLILPFSMMFVGCGDKKDENPSKTWAEMATDVPDVFSNQVSIVNANQLAWVAREVNSGNDFSGMIVKLQVDIDLKNILWTPIGYGMVDGEGNVSGKAFSGIFDGQNNTISNLYTKGESGVGLFGLVTGSIRNLNVVNAEIHGNESVGVIAGCAYSNSLDNEVSITKCYVKNVQINSKYLDENFNGANAGSIVGMAYNVDVLNCSVENAYVSANCNAGQIVGTVYYADFEAQGKIANVQVVWNQTGDDADANENINQTPAGKVAY